MGSATPTLAGKRQLPACRRAGYNGLPDSSDDLIVSNCVINLAADKDAVFAEAFRVLKAGGLFAVSDIVIHGGLPEALSGDEGFRREVSSWAGCIAGALSDAEYQDGLSRAGFADIELEITRRYSARDLQVDLPAGLDGPPGRGGGGRYCRPFREQLCSGAEAG